ncbi:MAG: DNA polymerase IV [Bryobacterales bacterium]|nr:DNA polymerase IV [Bryobacterales bacterium]
MNSGAERHRVVFHMDMDAFFVSVEELYDPSLKGKPVVVGGKGHERGVVSAASYAARQFGIHSAMPLRTAYQKCPQAIFLDGHRDRYSEHSRKVRAILEEFAPVVEMASIDEAYLEMTGTRRLYGPPLAAAHQLHERIRRQTRLNCSIGIGTSRLVAKVCSDLAKPNGLFEVLPGMEAAVLAPLPVGKIPGVGRVMQRDLAEMGVRRVGDLNLVDEQVLLRRFGKWGLALAGKAQGKDAGGWFDEEIGADDDPKSVSHEHTFSEDTADAATLEAVLARMAEMVGRRLRDLGLHARTVQLKLRDQNFRTVTRARTVEQRTNLDAEIFQEARALFRQHWKRGSLVRLIGVQASGLDTREGQLGLLDGDRHQRLQQALQAADKLRARFGEDSVSLAASMRGRFRERVHETMPQQEPGESSHSKTPDNAAPDQVWPDS